MSDLLIKACGAAVVGLALLLTLRGLKSESAVFVRAALTVTVVTAALGILSPAISFARMQLDMSGSEDYAKTMLKALGISYLTFICSSVCRDSGEPSVAAGVEAVGKAELVLLALPFLRNILQVMEELLGA